MSRRVGLSRISEGFTPPQKPKASAHAFVINNFSFLDLRGRSAKAWKIARPPPLGPQSPACCASPNARLITGKLDLRNRLVALLPMHMVRQARMYMQGCGWAAKDHLDCPAKMAFPGFRLTAHGLRVSAGYRLAA